MHEVRREILGKLETQMARISQKGTMNKEQIYDSQINPLMAQIIGICNQHSISFLASFAIPTAEQPDLYCTTLQPDETGKVVRPLAIAGEALRHANCTTAAAMITVSHPDGSKRIEAVLG